MPTPIHGRVYVYAELGTRPIHEYLAFGLKRADLLTGVLIGTVDVVDCEQVYRHDDEDNRFAPSRWLLRLSAAHRKYAPRPVLSEGKYR